MPINQLLKDSKRAPKEIELLNGPSIASADQPRSPPLHAGGPSLCGFQKRLIATVVPWMVLISTPVSSVGSVRAVLARCLILRGDHPVWITAAVDINIVAMPAVPSLVHQVGVDCGGCACGS